MARPDDGMPDVVRVEHRIRLATPADIAEIETLMKASVEALFPAFYDEVQTASSVRYIASVDRTLVADGTYFVIEAEGEVVACGGWSRRDKLFVGEASQEGRDRLLDPATEPAHIRAMFVRGDWTRRGLGTLILQASEDAAREEGFVNLTLLATFPGRLLYERYGFIVTGEPTEITLPDGVRVGCIPMDKPVA